MIIGMDFSSLEETEKQGGKFYVNHQEVDLVQILARKGANYARLRLWLDPYDGEGSPYMGGTCDLATVTRLARRAKDAGMEILLDLHYSDFWCDPGRQMIPKAWMGMDLEEMCQALYRHTADTLEHLKAQGLEPAAVQVGNEITNGMLWPMGKLTGDAPRRGYDALAELVRSGVKAVREHSSAKVLLHLERSGDKALWQEWFDEMIARGVEFDIIGASYYPYWHGTMEEFRDNMENCIARYGKDIWVVETSYPFTTRHFRPGGETANLCIADGAHRWDGSPVTHPLTVEGQVAFIRDLIQLVHDLPEGRGKAIFWWEPGWIPAEGSSWASEASLRYCGEEEKSTGNEWANQCLFDYEGNSLPALEVFQDLQHHVL